MGERRISGFYIPLLLYVVGLNVLVVTAVTLLHELGHAALGHWLGCGDIEIVLFSSTVQSTFSRMHCPAGADPGMLLMALSAFVFIVPLASLFLVLGAFKERYIGYIVLGVGVMTAAADLRLLTGSGIVKITMLVIGGLMALYGEERLINGIIATEIAANPPAYAAEKHKRN
jgi:small-conductance mechanosensitive channel